MKAGFCWNSRRWIVFFIASGGSKSCHLQPVGSQCDQCGYYEPREVTEHYKRKDRIICELFR
jgi:hypothetical protein